METTAAVRRRNKWKWRALSVWIVLVSVAWIIAWTANQNRIHDIQKSRVASCQKTYESFKEVFAPFFPPEKKRTKEQQNNLDKLNKVVDRLKLRCTIQTKVK